MCWGCFQNSIKFKKLKQFICLIFGHKYIDIFETETMGCKRCGIFYKNN